MTSTASNPNSAASSWARDTCAVRRNRNDAMAMPGAMPGSMWMNHLHHGTVHSFVQSISTTVCITAKTAYTHVAPSNHFLQHPEIETVRLNIRTFVAPICLQSQTANAIRTSSEALLADLSHDASKHKLLREQCHQLHTTNLRQNLTSRKIKHSNCINKTQT